MALVLFRAGCLWLFLVAVAIGNGVLREKWMADALPERWLQPVSGILLSLLIVAISYACVPFLGAGNAVQYICAGALWVALTLLFEFGFGHWVVGKSWAELAEVFNIFKGNLMLVVLAVCGIAPYLAARCRGLLSQRTRGALAALDASSNYR